MIMFVLSVNIYDIEIPQYYNSKDHARTKDVICDLMIKLIYLYKSTTYNFLEIHENLQETHISEATFQTISIADPS